MKNVNVQVKLILSALSMLLLIMPIGCSASEEQSYYQNEDQRGYNIQDLNEYGEWITINNYENVWHPYTVSNWMPFDYGHWVFSNSNWTWVSYEPFGWIVYHYGEWYDDPFYGWVWIPTNNIWSPANVSWITYGDYILRAPLGPRGVYYGNPWENDQIKFWHVVKASDFTRDNIRDYRVSEPLRNESERNIINHQPDRMFVEKNIGRAVPDINVQKESVKISNRNIERMSLPKKKQKELNRIHRGLDEKVLIPRDEFRKQQTVRNQGRERTK